MKQFKIPLPHQEIIQEFVEEMLDRKLIEVSRSRYNSPIFCVKKKNGSWRPVVDLRAINQATVEDFYSIRDIKSCIDEIGRENSTVFSSMDLSKGFFQQNLEEESRPYTTSVWTRNRKTRETQAGFGIPEFFGKPEFLKKNEKKRLFYYTI